MRPSAKQDFAQSAAPKKTKAKATYPSPVTVRLKPDEREQLELAANDLSLSAYIRLCLFGDDVPVHRTRGKQPVKDYQALGQLLGVLGRSNLANNINQLTKAAHSGTLDMNEDVEAQLKEAALEIASMRLLLIKALGMREDDQ